MQFIQSKFSLILESTILQVYIYICIYVIVNCTEGSQQIMLKTRG